MSYEESVYEILTARWAIPARNLCSGFEGRTCLFVEGCQKMFYSTVHTGSVELIGGWNTAKGSGVFSLRFYSVLSGVFICGEPSAQLAPRLLDL